MFSYVAYGLGIRSELPLPELVRSEEVADVIIRLGSVERLPSNLCGTGVGFRVTSEGVYHYLEDVGAFLVRSGREIIVDPVQGVEEGVLRLCILGFVLGVLLHQRGLLVLHASAITVNGGTVVFLGGSGWGKSTTAAALHACGHSIVADDVVALDASDNGIPLVLPALPRLKLCHEAAAYLGYDLDKLTIFDQQDERLECSIPHEFTHTPLPLRRIYVLAEGTNQEVEPLRPQEAFVELVRHSYPPVVRLLEATGAAASHFHQCACLASCVPICRLKRQLSLSALPGLLRLIEEDLALTIY